MHPSARCARIAAPIITAMAATMAVLAPAATAAPDSGSLGSVSEVNNAVEPAATAPLDQVGDGSPGAVSEYWSPARMEAAAPAEVVVPGEAERSAPAPTYTTPVAEPDRFRHVAEQAAPVPRVGKVFFTRGGRDYVCSASSVTAENRNLVATAGHCVRFKNQWVSSFIFVPAYSNGRSPYGQFSGKQVIAPQSWLRSENVDADTAFVTVGDVNGRSLADTVGTFEVGFNASRDSTYTAHGYPAEAPFDGRTHYTCTGPNSPDRTRLGIAGCGMNGGASGGPWISGDRQVSVNSYIREGDDGIYGPYWGEEIRRTYETAQQSRA